MTQQAIKQSVQSSLKESPLKKDIQNVQLFVFKQLRSCLNIIAHSYRHIPYNRTGIMKKGIIIS